MNYFDKKRKYLMNSKKTDEYIKDGLQLWLDGINNIRNGHSNTGYTWHDLSGNNYNFSFYKGNGPAGVEENCLNFKGNSLYRCQNTTLQELLMNAKERTIEIVCEISDDDTTAKTIFLGGGTANMVGVGMWYRPASSGMCVSSNSYAYQISDITNPHTYSVVYNELSISNVAFYQDNVQKGSRTGGTMANTYVTIGGRDYGTSSSYGFIGKIYCIRVYDRQLTKSERDHNRKVDKERFGI